MEAAAVQDEDRFAYEGASWWRSPVAAVLVDLVCYEITFNRAREALGIGRDDLQRLVAVLGEMTWPQEVIERVELVRRAATMKAGEHVSLAARAGAEGRYEEANRQADLLRAQRDIASELAAIMLRRAHIEEHEQRDRAQMAELLRVTEAPAPASVPDASGDDSGPLVSVVTDDGRVVSGRRVQGEPPPCDRDPDEGQCKSCKQPMVWVRLQSGKANPCDPPRLLVRTGSGALEVGRISHFATCPQADRHRRGAR